MIGNRLLQHHMAKDKRMNNKKRIKKILAFLCSESGSHDYSIYRREAKEELGLHIEYSNEADYKIIKAIYDDISSELLLTVQYNPDLILGRDNQKPYELHRALVESYSFGSNCYKSKGTLNRKPIPGPNGAVQNGIEDQRFFEGWEHEPA
jgi:hypothetical protein